MWLTLHFPDLCRCTCIYTYYPPVSPACPTSPYKYTPVRGSSCFGESYYYVMFHHMLTLSYVYRAIRPLGNCYAISCRVILRVKGCDHKKWCVLQVPITFYPYPYKFVIALYKTNHLSKSPQKLPKFYTPPHCAACRIPTPNIT